MIWFQVKHINLFLKFLCIISSKSLVPEYINEEKIKKTFNEVSDS